MFFLDFCFTCSLFFFFLLSFFYLYLSFFFFFFFSSRRRHTRSLRDWSSDVCSSDLMRDRGPKAKLLNDNARTGEVGQLFHRDWRDGIAFLRSRGRPFLGSETGQCLTDRAGAKSQAHRDFTDGDLGSRREPPIENLGQQMLVS